MYFATIDCGTTNSRIYILDHNFRVINKGEKKVGVKDTAINGSNQVLKEGLKEVLLDTVARTGLTIEQIKFAITSGMITSEIGLLEIPHLWAPVGIEELAEGVKEVNDQGVFPIDLPLLFIRGVKNYFPAETTYRDIRKIDFMRGEETQVVGLLSLYPELELPLNMVVLSSHTKFIHLNKEQEICGSITTLSGQTYEAIKKETFIGKSIQANGPAEVKDYLNQEIVDTAYDSVRHAGFLRTLLMPRFMEVLINTNWYERKLFVEAAIVSEDLRALGEFKDLRFSADSSFVLVGHQIRCRIMSYLLKKYYNITRIITIDHKEEIDQLSIAGAIMIARKNGYLKGSV